MNLKIMLVVLPAFAILSGVIIYGMFMIAGDIPIGIIYAIITIIVGFILLKTGLHSSQSHFKKISRNTVIIERIEFKFEDGVRTVGLFYRSASQTIRTPEGYRYPDPRPAVVFFHGFMNKKESSEKYLIPLAHMGYIGFAFDQRGHGEAGKGTNDRLQLFEDARVVVETVYHATDLRNGAVCCIGTSLGGTTVLTKCYKDERVAMVVGMSTFHSVAAFGDVKFNPFSVGKFFRWIMVKTSRTDKNPEVSPHFYLKTDPKFNKNRVFLIHGQKDVYFPPEITFELNKKQAGIPDSHTLLLDKAGHGLDNHELLVLATLIKWLNEHEKMTLSNIKTINTP